MSAVVSSHSPDPTLTPSNFTLRPPAGALELWERAALKRAAGMQPHFGSACILLPARLKIALCVDGYIYIFSVAFFMCLVSFLAALLRRAAADNVGRDITARRRERGEAVSRGRQGAARNGRRSRSRLAKCPHPFAGPDCAPVRENKDAPSLFRSAQFRCCAQCGCSTVGP